MSEKNNSAELTRDLVKAQREAKKQAKLAAKQKSKEKAAQNSDVPKDYTTKEEKTPAKNESSSELPDLSKLAIDKSKPTPDKSKPKPDKSKPTPDKSKPTPDKSKPTPDNSKPPSKKKSAENALKPSDNKENIKTKAGETKSKAQPKPKQVQDQIMKSTSKTTMKGKPASAAPIVHKVKLFNHLYRDNLSITQPSDVHPAIFRLGVQYSTGVVRGSNARCVALLNAIKQMVCDYTTPNEKQYSRGFEERLGLALAYLNKCRPHSVSMLNAVKHFKSHLTQLPNDITDTQACLKLKEVIATYIHEQIDMAGHAICMFFHNKLANGDIILTYGCSSLIEKIILTAHQKGTKLRVIIVDGSPWYEGKEMLRRLVKYGVDCSYVLLSAVSYIMREVSKVIIGAHALLSNGAVMSRAGTAHVSLVARTFNVPVLAACETHKFCERVQTDALVFNELGDPDELISDKSPAKVWKTQAYLTPLSLTYDITPSHLVTAVITELAIVPCTSVPVVLRVKPTESQ